MSKPLLTPKDLADAVGVSESSMRRWIDSGRLKTTRTAGGHRRVEFVEALRFIRESGTPLVRAEILGLGDVTNVPPRPKSSDDQQLQHAFAVGDRTLARGVVVSWHLAGQSLASIFDTQIQPALARMAELASGDRTQLLLERRASEICTEIIHHLRNLLPTSPGNAPLAMGAAPQEDCHAVSSQMVAAVAREAGLRDMNFGPNAPVDLLTDLAKKESAKLVWLCVTDKPKPGVKAQAHRLADDLGHRDATLVVIGPQAGALGKHPHMHHLNSMSELAAFLDGLRNGHRA
jgi:excisionase family DNA binding protein